MTGLDRAEHLLELRRPAEAEQVLRGALAKGPESSRALQLLARSLLDQDRPGDALEVATAAVSADPENSFNHRINAIALSTLNRHAGAVESARRAAALAPNSAEAHHLLAATLVEMDRHGSAREALEHAEEARRLAPNSADVHVVRGICLNALGRKEEAVRAYHEALAIEPDHATALNNLAANDINQGRITQASIRLTAALSGSPQEAMLRDNLDVVLLKVIRWNYFLTLGGGLLLCILAKSSAPVPGRGAVLVGLLAVLAANLYRVVRHFPRGSSRWIAALSARASGSAQYQLFLSVLAAGLATALGVLPEKQAGELAGHVSGFFTIGVLAGIFWTVRSRSRR